MRCLLALSLLGFSAGILVAGVAAAAGTVTYRWVDAQGVVHYSDTPHPGADVIQLSGAQTYHGTPAPAASPAAPPPPTTPADSGYQSCTITQPPPDTELFAPEAVNVSIQLVPALHAGDTVGVHVDGNTLPAAGNGLSFEIPQPERGSHTITAEVRGADGTVLCSAPAVTFSIQRPSVNTPTAPVKPH
jgi:uncharacterized protein DUF4124